jgi:hypothetical protein
MHKEKERDRDDQRIQAPFQNNFVADEEGGETGEPEPKIHSLEVTPPFPHLTQSAYEESLMNSQLNELSKEDKASGGRGRYNLRSDKRAATSDVSELSSRAEKPANEVADSHQEGPTPLSHCPKSCS